MDIESIVPARWPSDYNGLGIPAAPGATEPCCAGSRDRTVNSGGTGFKRNRGPAQQVTERGAAGALPILQQLD